MTERQHPTPRATAVRIAIAGAMLAGGALAMAGQATADPVPYPTPVPATPGATPPAPGQPVVEPAGVGPEAPPAPPPAGPPLVPEIANPVYGGGNAGNGPLANLRDLWHQAQDPYSFIGGPPDQPLEGTPPPPGAGPAPQLPAGYVSLTDPGSNGPPVTKNYAGGPALPPGYYPLNGPPPPDYAPPAPVDPAAPLPPGAPVPPTP
jgi:hypothetical protein